MSQAYFGSRALGCILSATLIGIVLPATARAQDAAGRVGILRSTSDSVPSELASAVDDALLRELADTAGIHDPTVAPTSYEAVQLAVGCEGETAECLSSVSQTLQVHAVIVRQLDADAAGLTTLALLYFEPDRSPTVSSAQATVTPERGSPPMVAAVAGLVRRLFAVPEASPPQVEPAPVVVPELAPPPVSPETLPITTAPRDSAQQTPTTEADRSSALATWGWITMLSGAAVLGTGAVVGLTAQASFDDIKRTDPRTAAEAERIHRDFESVETRATIANVLMPAGGAIVALGAVLLTIDLASGSNDDARATGRIGVTPVRGGALLTLSRGFGGL